MACTNCGKNKSSTYKSTTNRSKGSTTKPKPVGKSTARVIVGGAGAGTKSGSSYPGPRQSGHSTRTPISHAQSGRTRRH